MLQTYPSIVAEYESIHPSRMMKDIIKELYSIIVRNSLDATNTTEYHLTRLACLAVMAVNVYDQAKEEVSYPSSTIPTRALRAIARVMTEGADKYGENNWHSISCRENLDHATLHASNWLVEHQYDDLTHCAARCLMALDQFNREGWK